MIKKIISTENKQDPNQVGATFIYKYFNDDHLVVKTHDKHVSLSDPNTVWCEVESENIVRFVNLEIKIID